MADPDNYLWTYFVIFLGEATGTTLLLFFGCMGLIGGATEEGVLPSLQPALIWGTTITTIIMIFGHITRAHFNPCVTVCALVLRIINMNTAMVYFAAQMIGSPFGYFLLTLAVPSKFTTDTNHPNKTDGFCNTVLRHDATPFQGLLLEFMATSCLIYAVCSAWDPRNAIWSDSVAVKLGFMIIALVIAIGPFTGASLNPARSFGPALINWVWRNHWLYWIACIGAATFTTVLYKYVYLLDAEEYLKSKEQIYDQLRQGSLYSKQEADNLIPKTKTDKNPNEIAGPSGSSR